MLPSGSPGSARRAAPRLPAVPPHLRPHGASALSSVCAASVARSLSVPPRPRLSAGPPFGPVNGLLPPVLGVRVVGGRPDAFAPVRPPPSVRAGGGAGFGCVAFVGRAAKWERFGRRGPAPPTAQIVPEKPEQNTSYCSGWFVRLCSLNTTLNKTVILFRFFPVGGPRAAVAGGCPLSFRSFHLQSGLSTGSLPLPTVPVKGLRAAGTPMNGQGRP